MSEEDGSITKPPAEPVRAYTVSELAQTSGVPARRIRAAIRSGALPAMRIDSWARVWGPDFADWCRANTRAEAVPSKESEIRGRVATAISRGRNS